MYQKYKKIVFDFYNKKTKKIKNNFRKFFTTDVGLFIKKNHKQLYKYYLYGVVPLAILLVLYAAIFRATANNLDWRLKSIRIQRAASANVILFQLKREGMIRNKIYAKLAILMTNWHKNIYAGKYTLSPSMSTRQIFMELMGRKALSQDDLITILIPEGYSLQEIIERFDEYKVINKDIFYNYLTRMDRSYWQMQYKFLMQNDLDNLHFFEGYLYPDTYSFVEGITPEALLKAMLDDFQENMWPLLVKNKTELNSHELITLASIIEKEAAEEEERPIISGVFHNRLKKRMYLGSCPTVKYALGKPHKKYLLYKDLDVKSPYNTYRHLGLPPGPICSPGVRAVSAALNPAETYFLYFVAKGDGTHIFARTGAEHIRNKNKVNHGKIY